MASGNGFIALSFLVVIGGCLFILGWATYQYPLIAAAIAALALLTFIVRGVLS